ncbi:AAWKG family protein, partial [Streptomyces sp. NPDC001928]|uniref:AAWKG family protein n=1 Tax=Streptomyces sp. NPDC001928 TaxID=3154404 RepID=UPI00332FB09D
MTDKTPLEAHDDWRTAVELFTGYSGPTVKELFDDLAGSPAEIPMMFVEIKKEELVEPVDSKDTEWVSANTPFELSGKDIIIPFYNDWGDSGVEYWKVYIRLLGDKVDGMDPKGGVIDGSVGNLGEDVKGEDNKPVDWDTRKHTEYTYGTGEALKKLLDLDSGTNGFHSGNKSVFPESAVGLGSFETTALAFDRVEEFVRDRKDELHRWEKKYGATQNDDWKGYASGVFWELVHQLVRQYEQVAEDMYAGKSAGSRQGAAIRAAGEVLHDEVKKLYEAWKLWAEYSGNPLRWLTDLLKEIMFNVWDDNLSKITADYEAGSDYNEGEWTYTTDPGFSDEARDDRGNRFGNLDLYLTWKAVGEEAQFRWWESLRNELGSLAKEAKVNVANAWAKVVSDFGEISPPRGEDLETSFAEDDQFKNEEDIENEGNANEELINELNENMEEMKNEYEGIIDDLIKDMEENEKQNEEYINDLLKDMEENEKKNEEYVNDLIKDMEEKEKQNEEYLEELKKDQEEAEADAKADAEAAEKEREEEIKEQEAEQEADEREQEAKAEAAEKEREEELAEQKAEQEADEREQEAKEAAAEKEREQELKEQEAKQEADEREQEAKEAAAEKEREQELKEQKAEQEAAEQEAKAEQAAAEKEQEQEQKEQEQKQEEYQRRQELMQVQQMQEQRRLQEQQKKEQEKEEQEAEQEAAEQEAKAEREQEEQEREQEQLRKEQEAEQ